MRTPAALALAIASTAWAAACAGHRSALAGPADGPRSGSQQLRSDQPRAQQPLAEPSPRTDPRRGRSQDAGRALPPAADWRGTRAPGETAAQALIGFSALPTLDFSRTDAATGRTVRADLSTMPVIGFAGLYALGGAGGVELGLDGGLLLSWASASSSRSDGGGALLIDNSLVLVDGYFGPYASLLLGDRVRLHAGAAPDVLWGDAKFSDELGSSRRTGLGIGVSARAGVEFRLRDRSLIGLTGRWLSNELAFGGGIGDVEVQGLQILMSYTVGF